MQNDLRKDAAARKVLLVAHRGAPGGDIPCNTIAAYDIALARGADMLEIDVDMTSDGKLVIFHPWMERPHLGYGDRIARHPWSFVKELRFQNADGVPTPFGICTLDDVLDRYRGRCYLNVDKFWEHPAEIAAAIRARGMQDQCLVKTGPDPRVLGVIEEHAADMPFMGIVRSEADCEAFFKRQIRLEGFEVLFRTDDSPLASPAFAARQHDTGRLLWANAIVYDFRDVIAAGHSDDRAMTGDPEGSWGWLADRGFDFIQTDWVRDCADFLESTGRRTPGAPSPT